MVNYTQWDNYAASVAENKMTAWKTHPHVAYMLEHEWESAAIIRL